MIPPVLPAGLEPLRSYLTDLDNRVSNLEEPQQPGRVFACTTTNLPPAAQFVGCVVRNTTLDVLAHSNGSHWIREDTGGVIV